MSKIKIAAIFAHPDDEVLACGATLARHAEVGDVVQILILASGLSARGGALDAELAILKDQARKAASVLGAQSIDFADFPDNAMDAVPLLDVIQRIEGFLVDFPAATIYTHHSGDLNIDHKITQQAVMTACRPLPGSAHTTILAGEVNSSTEWAGPQAAPFVPSEFIDISATLEKKCTALECYEGEIRDWPHPRSTEALRILAKWRGSQSGCSAAEAFVTLRRILVI